jgi:hypothetical protein
MYGRRQSQWWLVYEVPKVLVEFASRSGSRLPLAWLMPSTCMTLVTFEILALQKIWAGATFQR